jgi:hypothetical protein
MKPWAKRKEKSIKSIYWCEFKQQYIPAMKAMACCQDKKHCVRLKILNYQEMFELREVD